MTRVKLWLLWRDARTVLLILASRRPRRGRP